VLNDAARAAVDAGRLAHLTTINADGSPQTTVVWVGMDGDHPVMASLDDRAKLRNIRRDPRVSVSLEAEGTTYGLPNYLVLEGTAEVVEGGASEWLQHLAHTYLGPDAEFPPPHLRRPGFRMVVTVTKARGNGPWSQDDGAERS
jgi:PPOX class probable F420-dependent enzyme